MHRLRSIVLLFLNLTTSWVFAASVSESEALNIATQFQHAQKSSKLRSTPVFHLVLLRSDATIPTTCNPAFFVFNIGDSQGFVIVSGETGTKSILGYSDRDSFPVEHMPDNLKAWLDMYEQEIKALRSCANHDLDSSSLHETQLKSATPIISPLLGTNNWAQLNPFNLYCPWDYQYKARSAVGCVALAMGQIMAYHHWPIKPKGQLKYYVDNMGLQSVDLDTVTYDWERMSWPINPYSPTVQDTLIARLLYHCGSSVYMQYSAIGSGADVAQVGPALVEHFDYDPDIQYYKRMYFTSEIWNAMIQKELDEERPVLYAAFSKNVGHVFICDGYDDNLMFHINWGWGGNGNGYFELSSLNAAYPNVEGAPNGYSNDQSMLIRIQRPDSKNNTTYSLCLPDGNVQIQTTAFFCKDAFSMSFNCMNLGTNTFVGYLGLGYYDSNYQLKLLDQTATNLETIHSGAIKFYAQNNLTLPCKLGDGFYNVFPVYRPNNAINWSILPGSKTIHLQIGGETAKFIIGNSNTLLELRSPIHIVHQLYQNQKAELYVTFMNYNEAFNVTLMIDLYSTPNAQFLKTIYQGIHQIQGNAVQTIKLNTKIICPQGNYTLVVRSNSLYDKNFIVRMEPSFCNNVNVRVNPVPSPPVLVLTDSIRIKRALLLNLMDSLSLRATVANRGGFTNALLVGLVYAKGGSICLDTLSAQEISIDSTERITVNIYGNLRLHDGAYQLTLCEKKDSVFVPLNPLELSSVPFLIGNPLACTDSLHVYWHLSNDELVIEGPLPVDEVYIYTISGIQKLHIENQTSISLGNLPKGLYFMKVSRNKNVFYDKFFKN